MFNLFSISIGFKSEWENAANQRFDFPDSLHLLFERYSLQWRVCCFRDMSEKSRPIYRILTNICMSWIPEISFYNFFSNWTAIPMEEWPRIWYLRIVTNKKTPNSHFRMRIAQHCIRIIPSIILALICCVYAISSTRPFAARKNNVYAMPKRRGAHAVQFTHISVWQGQVLTYELQSQQYKSTEQKYQQYILICASLLLARSKKKCGK